MADTLTMGRGTTPTYLVTFRGIDFEDIDDIYFTFEQSKSNQELTKHFPEVEAHEEGYATVSLTQAETLAFAKGNGKIQIRFINKNGKAFKTSIVTMEVSDVLYEEVI